MTRSVSFSEEVIQSFLEDSVTQNYVSYAVLTALAYDTAILFEKEVKYYWKTPINTVSFLYFLNRYGAILSTILVLLVFTRHATDQMSLAILHQFTQYSSFEGAGTLLEGIISIILLAAFAVDVIVGITLAVYGVVLENPLAYQLTPNISSCLVYALPPYLSPLSWSIPMAFGMLLLVLALYQARIIWKETAGLKGFNLVGVLVRDQLLYYLAVILVSLAKIVGVDIAQTSLVSRVISLAGNPAVLSLLGARVLFNMKEAAEKGLNQGTNCNSVHFVVSMMDFAEPVKSETTSEELC